MYTANKLLRVSVEVLGANESKVVSRELLRLLFLLLFHYIVVL